MKPIRKDYHKQVIKFNSLPSDSHVKESMVLTLFGINPPTLQRWIKKGVIPRPHKLSVWNVGELRMALKEFKPFNKKRSPWSQE